MVAFAAALPALARAAGPALAKSAAKGAAMKFGMNALGSGGQNQAQAQQQQAQNQMPPAQPMYQFQQPTPPPAQPGIVRGAVNLAKQHPAATTVGAVHAFNRPTLAGQGNYDFMHASQAQRTPFPQ